MPRIEVSKDVKLTIMSYNIQMLSIPFSVHLNSWTRRNAIIDYICSLDDIYDIDILVLNEVFTKKCYKLLTSGKIKEKFPYHTNVIGRNYKRHDNYNDSSSSTGQKEALSFHSSDTNINIESTRGISNYVSEQMEYIRKNKENPKNKLSKISEDISENSNSSYNSNFDTVTGKRKFFHFVNGGVIVLSKHKILHKHALIYSSGKFPDVFCSKGAIYLKCDVMNKKVNVVATHLQAGDNKEQQKCRWKQIDELSKWVYEGIPSTFIKKFESLFFVGDFNIRYNADRLFLDKVLSDNYLNSYVTKKSLDTTYDSFLNDYCRYIERDYNYKHKYTLDYILVANNSNVEIIVPQTSIQNYYKSLYFIKFFLGIIPYKTTYIHHPSDHFPIYATFLILS
ncbi:sphingomyelin phosphodiesterase, putative [Plasmodium sp. gorilla clade G3]|nr:sphingomyelin phosphodiesterase, putative [Plasmodium sp. gorilla clade G3]